MSYPITPERRKQLSEKHAVNEQYLYQCLTGRRDMGPAEAMRLEMETQQELTRQMLCQKTYTGIWPELAVQPAPLPVAADKETDRLMAEGIKDGVIKDRRDPSKPGRRELDTKAYAALESIAHAEFLRDQKGA